MTLLLSLSLQQNHQKRQRFLFFNSKAIKEGDGSHHLPSSSLQWNHRRRWQLIVVAFFTSTKQKTRRWWQQSCCHLLCCSKIKTKEGNVVTKKTKKVTTTFIAVTFFVVVKPKRKWFKGGSLPSSSHSGSHFNYSDDGVHGLASSALSWLYSCSCSNRSQALSPLLSFGDGVSAKSSEVGRRGEVGGREVRGR